MKTQKELELEAKAKAEADASQPSIEEAVAAETKQVRLLKPRAYPATDNDFIVYEVSVGTVETLPIALADELIAAGAAEDLAVAVQDTAEA